MSAPAVVPRPHAHGSRGLVEGWLEKKTPGSKDRDKGRTQVKRLMLSALRGGEAYQRRFCVLDPRAGELAYLRSFAQLSSSRSSDS